MINEPRYVQTKLSNGMRVIMRIVPERPVVNLSFTVLSNASMETPETYGIAHLCEHMLFRGTQSRNGDVITKELMEMGNTFDAFTTAHHVTIGATLTQGSFMRGFNLLKDMLLYPLFDNKFLDIERQIILHEMEQLHDDIDYMAYDALFKHLWGDHPLSMFPIGTMESVSRITSEEASRFWRKRLCGRGVIAHITCDENFARNIDINQLFSDFGCLPSGSVDWYEVPEWNKGDLAIADESNLVRVHMAMEGVHYDHPDDVAGDICCSILGEAPFGSIYQVVREQQGLAYDVGMFRIGYYSNGVSIVRLLVGHDDVDKAVSAAFGLVKDLSDNLVDNGTLESVINSKRERLVIMSASPSYYAESDIARAAFNLPHVSIKKISDMINKVTAEDISNYARRMLSSTSVCAYGVKDTA